MFRRELEVDNRSYLELVSRLAGPNECLAFVLRGPKENNQTQLTSVLLRPDEVRQVIDHLQNWLTQLDAKPVAGPIAIQV